MKAKKTSIIIDRDKVLSYAMKANPKERDWYLETRQTIVEIFGESEAWFVCQLLASTSINSTLRSNISLFIKAYIELKTELGNLKSDISKSFINTYKLQNFPINLI